MSSPNQVSGAPSNPIPGGSGSSPRLTKQHREVFKPSLNRINLLPQQVPGC